MQLLSDFNENSIRNISKKLNEPEWLLNFRLSSFQHFISLPPETSPLYTKYYSMFSFELNGFKYSMESKEHDFKQTFTGFLTGKETNITVNANEKEIHTELEEDISKLGVRIMSISDAIRKNEDLLKKIFYSKLVSSEKEKYSAFVNSFFNCGTFVYVPKNVTIERPLRKMLLTYRPENSIIEQTVIYVEEQSRLNFLEEYYSKEEADRTIVATNVDIFAGSYSSVDYSSVQLLSDNILNITNRGIGLSDGSRVTLSSLSMGSEFSRSRTNFYLNGRGSFCEGFEIFFTDKKQRYDYETNLLHISQDTTGSTQARGVLKGESRSIFKGMIKIVKDAKNSRSYLAHHAMILERTARSDAIPGLEIDTNDVKATHSASVAQVDEEQVFYLMSRGIDQNEAKKMIVLGFFEPVLAKIPIADTRDGSRFMLEGKWYGEKRRLVDRETILRLTGETHEARQTEDIFERHYKYR